MAFFKVVEEIRECVVKNVFIIEADTKEDAEEDPHSAKIIKRGRVVEEGGCAVTVECVEIPEAKLKKALALVD
jgi:hypothetical protein